MGEIMRPLPFSALAETAIAEYKREGSVFGIRKEKFYQNVSGTKTGLWGEDIASPIGPAAGPNTQLAQNIVASFLAGSRVIELKTVQTMDGEELRNCVARPCINATDECYNVEWSTELTVQQAFDEYVKAWFLVHVLGREFGLDTGILFNMSVGYSLDGIKSDKIDRYIEGMKHAGSTPVWEACTEWLKANCDRFEVFGEDEIAAISETVSDSITLSTLHGCPADEIEKIAYYLLTEKKVHTYVKCNPTLLGYEDARRILDSMGFGYIAFDDHHFKEDLQFADAVAMISRLSETADDLGLGFGVKITNTFPVDIRRGELPGDEMYMSGRALYPLSLTVAARLSAATNSRLAISYSGGADAFNLKNLLEAGVRPVTFATTILKPGGYERIHQLAGIAEAVPQAGQFADTDALAKLAADLTGNARYRKEYRTAGKRKSDNPLALFDCGVASCSVSGCPINQQIPAYLEQVAKGDYKKAFEIISNDNVLPSVTGAICDHQCQNKCLRTDYEDSVRIRQAKKLASEKAQREYTENMQASMYRTEKKAVVIGAGPAGLAAAVYLRRNGVPVTVREKREKPLGIVSHVIPDFRIPDAEIALDAGLAQACGVGIEFGVSDEIDIKALRAEYDFVIIATGAWEEGKSALKADGKHVADAISFLAASRESRLTLDLGKRVGIIGGGDVAMDCARAAIRNSGVTHAEIVYRRTREFMPAQREEIELAEADGVVFHELRAPVRFENGVLECGKLALGDYDMDGRRSVVQDDGTENFDFDTVIIAVGARVDSAPFTKNGLKTDDAGLAILDENCESSVSGVFVCGDCKSGPATVVKAMADAKRAALRILANIGIEPDFTVYETEITRDEAISGKGILIAASDGANDGACDAERCLSCNTVCEICADVCPNRANIAVDTVADAAFGSSRQIVHIDAMCNECGNCGIFCPSAGDPYKDKFTVFSTEEDFAGSTNRGIFLTPSGSFRARLEGGVISEGAVGSGALTAQYESMIGALEAQYAALLS